MIRSHRSHIRRIHFPQNSALSKYSTILLLNGRGKDEIYRLNEHEMHINHYNIQVLFISLLNTILKNYDVQIGCNF